MNTSKSHTSKRNFHTASSLVNFGIDNSFYVAAGLDLKASRQLKVATEDLAERYNKAQILIQNSLPQLFWHSVELQKGRDNGFQLFLDTNWSDLDEFAERMEQIWNAHHVVNSAEGDSFELQDCPYFAKNCKQVSKAALIRAIKREEKTLLQLLSKVSMELELGQVHGNGAVLYS